MNAAQQHHYRRTESKYKGGARDMFVTYDLKQKTRNGGTALYPKVKRVYDCGSCKKLENRKDAEEIWPQGLRRANRI